MAKTKGIRKAKHGKRHSRKKHGEIAEVKTPKTIVMRYLGYLETLEKNSPIFSPTKD